MGWVRGHLRRDGTYVPPHYRRSSRSGGGYSHGSGAGSGAEAAGFAALIVAIAVVGYLVWKACVGILWVIGYLACAVADGAKWAAAQLAGRAVFAWGRIRGPLARGRVTTVGWVASAAEWMASARYDLTGDHRRSANPMALAAKLAALVGALLVLFAVAYRLCRWVATF